MTSEMTAARKEAAEFRQEMRSELRNLESRLVERIHALDTHVGERFEAQARANGEIIVRIEQTKADLMKWSFVFWCGAVAAIAALAGVLRQ